MLRSSSSVPLFLAMLFPAIAVSPSFATDGVLEINQTCAVNTGCFAGDVAGFPVEIDGSAGRSYRLTGDLIVPDANTDGISVTTPSITIDLNGFEIARSGCQGSTTNCAPASGTGSGIKKATYLDLGISVRNGSITGMGLHGVDVGAQAEVTALRVRWNRLDGISASQGSKVSGCTAYRNGRDGIVAGDGSVVSGSAVFWNGHSGIKSSGGSVVRDNSVSFNSWFGLELGTDDGYHGNVISNNTTGTVSGGVNLGENACNGIVCP